MASKALVKRIRSLQQKKYRLQHNQFVVEGRKPIEDFLKENYHPVNLCVVGGNQHSHNLFSQHLHDTGMVQEVSLSDMRQMTGLSTACDALAVFRKRESATEYLPSSASSSGAGIGRITGGGTSDGTTAFSSSTLALNRDVNLALDRVQDPGNLGTLIRMSDWFGLRNILCSSDCCDCYNPKVVRATSGSLARVRVHYIENLHETLKNLDAPLLGASMDGRNIYEEDSFPKNQDAVLVMGSEGQGLSPEVREVLHGFVSIPSYSSPNNNGNCSHSTGAESLNVAMAASILISEIKRASG